MIVFRLAITEEGRPMVEVWETNVFPPTFICGIYSHKNAINIVSKYLKSFKEVPNIKKVKSVNGRNIRQVLIEFEEELI